jgi:phosphohistidine phosphatase
VTKRTLVLLRHAKAEAAADKPDIDRRLSSRGHADSAAAGAWLGAQGHRPELVICSPARRTRQTWHAIAVALSESMPEPPRPTVRYEIALYNGTATDLLGLVHGVAAEIASVLLIGHNPTVSQLSALLDPQAGMDSGGLRTGGIAVHQVTGEWGRVGHPPRTRHRRPHRPGLTLARAPSPPPLIPLAPR